MDIVTENVRSILSIAALFEASCAVSIVAIASALVARASGFLGRNSMPGRDGAQHLQFQPVSSTGRSRSYRDQNFSTSNQVEAPISLSSHLVDGLRNQLRLFKRSN